MFQIRCRSSSDTVPSRALDTFMSVCHHSPTAKKARQRGLAASAQTIMEWAAIVVAEPGNVAHVFAKDVGVPEAFGSST